MYSTFVTCFHGYRCSHRNIVRLVGYCIGPKQCLVYEYMPGNSLASWLDKVGPARSCVISIECTVHCIRRCPAAGSYTIELSVGLNCELLSVGCN